MNMIEVKTAGLAGPALDWAVAQIEGVGCTPTTIMRFYRPSTDWAQGGPLIEKHHIEIVSFCGEGWECVKSWCHGEIDETYPFGETHLIAACRAIVAVKLGDVVSVPAELVGVQSNPL